MENPSTKEIEAVVALNHHRNFRKAAIELGVKPSALSHSIRSLENRLGVRLFNRTTRSVSPTDAGLWLIAKLQPVLGNLNVIMEELGTFRNDVTGRLRINCGPLATGELFRCGVHRFLSANPGVELDIVTEAHSIDIVDAGFDAGVRLWQFIPQDMIAFKFGRVAQFICVASPSYLAANVYPKHPRDLAVNRCIRYRMPNGRLLDWSFRKGGEHYKITPVGQLTLSNTNAMIDAAIDGLGVAYVLAAEAESFIKDGSLEQVMKDWVPRKLHFALYYPANKNTPRNLLKFAEFLRGTFDGRA